MADHGDKETTEDINGISEEKKGEKETEQDIKQETTLD